MAHDPKKQKSEKQWEECRKEAEEYLAGWKRERADFLNYKKEEHERQKRLVEFANERLLEDLFPIIDSLERAEAALPEEKKNDATVRGLLQTIAQLKAFLKQHGVEELKVKGEFNPELHEAVMQEERAGAESGEIIEVVEKGYTLHGKVIRAAKVKLAK